MEKQERKYDLKNILTEQSFNRLHNYLSAIDKFGEENDDYGRDAFAMIGSSAKPNQVCQMFNLLANPEYINLRSDWGDITGQVNEVIPNIEDYATGTKNSFAIKKNNATISAHMDFPLSNSYMSVDGQMEDIPLQTSWGEQKKLFEKSLGMKIIDNQEFDAFFDYAKNKGSNYVKFGTENVAKETAAKIVHTSFSVLKKMFKAVKLEDKFPFNKQMAKLDPSSKVKVCFVSKKFKESNLSNLDKFVSLVDALTYEKVQPLLNNKDVANDLKRFSPDTKRKILIASKLIANWAVCMASDLGKENHKQMDNALKLEINSVLGTLPQENRNVTTAIANISNDLTAEMFKGLQHLNYASIVEHRKELGIEYVDDFNLGKFATWDIMKANNPNALDLNQVLFGKTIDKAFMLSKDKITYKGYSPAFNELQPDAELVKESAELEPIKVAPVKVATAKTTPAKAPEVKKDEVVGKAVGLIVPKGVTYDNIVNVDSKNKTITYKDKNGNEQLCNYLAFDGKEYKEFINVEGFGKSLTLADDNVTVLDDQNKYYGNFVKFEDLSKFNKIVEESKNATTTYSAMPKSVVEPAVPTTAKRPMTKTNSKAEKPNFGPVSLGYVIPVGTETKDIIVGLDIFNTPAIALLDKDRKLDSNGNPKFAFCNRLLEENGELKLVTNDNTFDSVISEQISLDKDLRVIKTDKYGKEKVVGFLIKNNEIAEFKEKLDASLVEKVATTRENKAETKSNKNRFYKSLERNKKLREDLAKERARQRENAKNIKKEFVNVADDNNLLKGTELLSLPEKTLTTIENEVKMLSGKDVLSLPEQSLTTIENNSAKRKKKGVCPKYDKEKLYQLYANGVLPELDNKSKKRTKENPILISEETKKKKRTSGKPSLKEINPELFQ